jgi:streptomycin 6-kinase
VTSSDAAIERVVATAADRIADHPALAPILVGLPTLLADLVDRWALTLGEVFDEGLGGPVLAVESSGRAAVLKIGRAGPAFAAQVGTMQAAGGRGYAAVLAADVPRGAVLLERLGPSLASARLAPDEQVRHLTAALRQAWEVAPDGVPHLPHGGDKATELVGIVDRFRRAEDDERRGGELAEAIELGQHLANTRDTGRDVLCHGDPHSGNALLSRGIPRYKLVDPDGFRCEPEYDVGVVLRDFSRELLRVGGRRRARDLHARLTRQAADATGTDPERVRQWAFVERVTTGLYLRWFEDDDAAQSFLDAAELLLE